MQVQDWKGKALKPLSTSQRRKRAGRNSSGIITMFHRGGGSKRLFRIIDLKRNVPGYESTLTPRYNAYAPSFSHTDRSSTQWCEGVVERVEYDPNRSSQIALIRWLPDLHRSDRHDVASINDDHNGDDPSAFLEEKAVIPVSMHSHKSKPHAVFSYILAYDQIKWNHRVLNIQSDQVPHSHSHFEMNYQRIGSCMPLHMIAIGTLVHNIELHPNQGGKLVRSAGTFARVMAQHTNSTQCVVRLPSGIEKLIHPQCRATIGIVSNGSHNSRKLSKAGQNRWLRRRPVVRGVAMNPIDHPHGGGEGRTKGGRPSVSPWGKPTKSGFKTAIKRHRS